MLSRRVLLRTGPIIASTIPANPIGAAPAQAVSTAAQLTAAAPSLHRLRLCGSRRAAPPPIFPQP